LKNATYGPGKGSSLSKSKFHRALSFSLISRTNLRAKLEQARESVFPNKLRQTLRRGIGLGIVRLLPVDWWRCKWCVPDAADISLPRSILGGLHTRVLIFFFFCTWAPTPTTLLQQPDKTTLLLRRLDRVKRELFLPESLLTTTLLCVSTFLPLLLVVVFVVFCFWTACLALRLIPRRAFNFPASMMRIYGQLRHALDAIDRKQQYD